MKACFLSLRAGLLHALLILGLAVAAGAAVAAADNGNSGDEVLDARMALDRFMDGLESFSADFTQTIRDDTGYTLQESDGSMHLGLPNRLRWEVTEPFPQIIVSDGESLWTYDPDLSQATVRPLGDAFDVTPVAAITQPEQVEDHFRLFMMPAPSGEAMRVIMMPRSDQADFTGLEVDLTPEGHLVRMGFRDIFGQETEIRFRNAERNPDLAPGTFRFDPPAGTDIYRP